MAAHWTVRTKIQHRLERLAAREYALELPVADIKAWFTPHYVAPEAIEFAHFRPLTSDTIWGTAGEKGYFRLQFVVPGSLAGDEVRLLLDSGGEGLCYRDGEPWQGVDWAHPEALLADPARGDEVFDLLIEARPSRNYRGPAFPPGQMGRATTPGVRFAAAKLVTINRPVRAFLRAARLLNELAIELLEGSTRGRPLRQLKEQFYYELTSNLPDGNFRTEQLLAGLNGALDRIDLNADARALGIQASEALSVLDPLLRQPGAPRRFVINALPHSHLDVAWVWTLDETVRKSARTLATTLRLLDLYPHYRFLQSQPLLLQMVKEHFPALYRRAQDAVLTGRLEIGGAMWVEPDLNLPSGESLVRQLLLGSAFWRTEFSAACRMLFLPDAFGDTAALPQILAQAGVRYFMTVKINTNDRDRFPYAWFWWQGIDGSRVLAHQPPSLMDGLLTPAMLIDAERRFPQHGEVETALRPWGLSDGGGGPTEEDVERLRQTADLDGLPKVAVQAAKSYFDEVAARSTDGSPRLPVWRGELYFERHRGVYTTGAAIKRLNRRAELLLYEAEMLAALTGHVSPSTLRSHWQTLCVQQFHDILTGNSIAEVNQRAIADLEHLARVTEDAVKAGLTALAGSGEQLMVWNPLGWARTDTAYLPSALRGTAWQLPDGNPVPTQETGQGTLILAPDVPGVGYLRLSPARSGMAADPAALSGTQAALLRWDEAGQWAENGLVRVHLNRAGQLISLFDLRAEREVLQRGAVGNELRLHEDIPAPGLYGLLDSVEIGAFYRAKYETLEAEEITLIERGPLRVAWRAVYATGRSRIVQEIRLRARSARLEFATHIDWHEDERLLRTYFPIAVNADRATYEIQFGALARPTHENTTWEQSQFEVPGHKWADLSEEGYGVALLNDSKYGYSVKHGVLGLSLLRATRWPDPAADRGDNHLTYALYPHLDGYQGGGVVQEALAMNVPLRAVQAAHGPRRQSFLAITGENMVLSALKPAEDGQGMILRLYEAHNRRGPVRVQGPFRNVETTTLLEAPMDTVAVEAAPTHDGAFTFDARPYGIHTFRLS